MKPIQHETEITGKVYTTLTIRNRADQILAEGNVIPLDPIDHAQNRFSG